MAFQLSSDLWENSQEKVFKVTNFPDVLAKVFDVVNIDICFWKVHYGSINQLFNGL